MTSVKTMETLFAELAAKAEERGWRMSEEATAAAEKKLAERGLTIGTVPPDVMEAFRKIGGTMAEEWVGRVGEDGRKLVDSLRAAR